MNTARSGGLSRILGAGALAATLATMCAGSASASSLNWNMSFFDGTNTLTATITTKGTLDSGAAPKNASNVYGYDITAITGTIGGNAITGLFTDIVGGNPFVSGSSLTYHGYSYDNIVFTTGPKVDGDGLGFTAGGVDYNVFWNGDSYTESSSAGGDKFFSSFFLTQATIPEPASIAVLMLGVAGLGFVRRRKVRAAA